MKRAAAVALSVIIALSMIGTGIAIAQDAPGAPAAYYGSVQDSDGNGAPAGTTIVAVVDGQAEGEITIAEAGQYGGSNATDDKLRIDSGAGETVTFHVGSADGAQATSPGERKLESGTQEVNLVFPVGSFTDGGADSGSEDGSTSETDETTTEDGSDTTDEDDATAGGGGGSDDTSEESETTTEESDGDDSQVQTTTDSTTVQTTTDSTTVQTTTDSTTVQTTTDSTTVQTTTDSTTVQTTETDTPGFTMGVALIALLGAALLALRRRE